MNRIKLLRKKNNWTQDELGNMLQVQKAAISKYETGTIPLTDETILKLSQIFNVSTDYLLGRDEKEQKNTHLSETERRVQKFYEEHPIMYDLVDAISRLDKEQQKALLEYAEFQAQKYKQKD